MSEPLTDQELETVEQMAAEGLADWTEAPEPWRLLPRLVAEVRRLRALMSDSITEADRAAVRDYLSKSRIVQVPIRPAELPQVIEGLAALRAAGRLVLPSPSGAPSP